MDLEDQQDLFIGAKRNPFKEERMVLNGSQRIADRHP